ncbi:MAG: site-specific integrase [Clostridia bacterium]|nr:site-specific integrase [Clostridia bacterium]
MEITKQLQSGIAVWENGLTFAELSDIWLNQYNPTATERWMYAQNHLLNKHLLPAIGQLKVRDLRQIHLQSIISSMAKMDYATGTMKQVKQSAVRIMKVAVDSDLIMRNPFQGVSVPNKEPEARQPLTPEQITLVTDNWRGHRFGHAGMIMLYAGLRRGELLALTWEDIDLNRRIIHVNKSVSVLCNKPKVKTPKTKSGTRDVPIPDILMQVLIELKKPNGLVCTSTKGVMMSEVAYRNAWASYLGYLNVCAGGKMGGGGKGPVWVIEKFTAHQMRHSYASMLFDAGVDVKSAQKFLGHTDIEVTLSIYTHLSKFKEETAINALNEHINKINR